ncbi:MAG: SET domain-containing protein [Bdellovibrio bacteriovorus]
MASRRRRDDLGARVRKAPSPIHGFGCFARIAFQRGDRIGTYDGTEVVEDGTYVLWVYDAEGQVLSAREGRNLLRWLNHSPDPNAEFDLFELFARRPIAAGEEITIDYGGAAPP